MADDISVRIGGDSSEAQKAISDATQALKDGVTQMTSPLQALTDGFAKFKGVLMGAAAILAGGKMFKDAIGAANEWNNEVTQLSRSMGVTTQEASVMAVALNHIGLSTQTISSATMMLSRQMNTNANAFKVLGVETKNAETGALRPITEVMADVNEKLKGIDNTTQQNIAGMQVYGRGWGEIRQILRLTPEAMQEAEEKAKSLHLIVGPEGAASTRKYKEEQRDLNLVVKSLEIQIGNALLPVLVKLGAWMGSEGPAMVGVFGKVLQSLVATVQTVYYAFVELGNVLGGVAAAAVELAHGNLSRSKAILNEITADNQRAAQKVKEIWAHAYDAQKMPDKAAPKGDEAPALDFSKEKKGPKEQDTRLQEWKNQLDQMKEAEGTFFKDSKQMEESFWTAKLAEVQGNGEKEKQIRRSIEHELYNIHKAQALQGRALDEEEVTAKKNQALSIIDIKRDELKTQEALGEINGLQMLQGERTLTAQQFNIELAALNSKLDLYKEDVVAFAKLQEDKLTLERKYAKDVEKINADMRIKNKQNIDAMLGPITNAISTSVQGIVQGTTTMKKALSNIFKSILAEFVSFCAKQLAKWAATELAKTALLKSGTLMRTALEKMGLLETESASLTSNATKAASTIATADEEIVAVAPVAASKAASAEADIPYVGPILAVAAFAAMLAMILGSRGHAVGSWDVPGDMITKIHKGEMIIPEQFAQNMREGGQMGGGGGTNIHIHAVDAKSVTRLLQDNASGVSQVARRLSRNFAPRNM
jgi:hypothetical protein